jgi:hypothetical protein
LRRTPNRPKAVFGLPRAAEALGNNSLAMQRYWEFQTVWKDADSDRPEVATAEEFLAKKDDALAVKLFAVTYPYQTKTRVTS